MSSEILDSVDGALHDWETSSDAMRWVPEGERLAQPTVTWGVPARVAGLNISRAFHLAALNMDGFRDAMTRVAEAVNASMDRLRSLVGPQWFARRRVGGAGDPASNDWQSGPCSGWLHDACPDPTVTDCRCTCHGGHLR